MPSRSPEEWAHNNLELLAAILAEPHGDHEQQIRVSLSSERVLDAHVAGVVRVLQGLRTNPALQVSYTSDAGIALHALLYHLLGGRGLGLPSPALDSSRPERERCAPGWAVAKPASARFFASLRKARLNAKTGDEALLTRLRTQPFLHEAHKNLRIGQSSGVVTTGGQGDPPALNEELLWSEQSERLLAFAMGTHPRLGEGNAHRAGPCVVRLIAGNLDVGLRIAAHVRDLPPRVLSPPHHETIQLRALNWRLQTELHAERTARMELSLTLESERREWRRERVAFEFEASMRARQLESHQIEAQAKIEEIRSRCMPERGEAREVQGYCTEKGVE